MSQTLLIALAVSIPLALLAWLAASAVEAMGAGLALRLRVWTAAFILPMAVAPAMLAIQALNIRSPLAELRQPPAAVVLVAQMPAPSMAAVPLTPARWTAAPTGETWVLILLGLVSVGAALRLGGLALALARVARMAARSEAIGDPALASRLGRGVRQADNSTPILAGLLRPTILLPRALVASLSADQAVLVCAHERAHLAAGDHFSHLLEETMVRVFWFNPFLAAVRERLAAAREESCDAHALAGCDDAHRRAYAQTLIAALRLAGPAEPVAALTGFRRRGAQRRVRAILRPTGQGSARALIAAIAAGIGLTAALGGLSLALAAEQPPALPAPPSAAAIPAPPAPMAPAAPPEPAAPLHPGRHHMTIILKDADGAKPGKAGAAEPNIVTQTMVFDDADLTPEQRERVKQAMDQARAAMDEARAKTREAMAHAREQMAEAHARPAEARGRIHEQVERALKEAHVAMSQATVAQNDGRVLMRCKLKPDGKVDDCERAFPGRIMRFELTSPPGMPPLPPLPPAPAAPPLG